jgi:hypothetical protein
LVPTDLESEMWDAEHSPGPASMLNALETMEWYREKAKRLRAMPGTFSVRE